MISFLLFIMYNKMKAIHFIKKHSNLNWNWYTVSKCKSITWEDIKENIELPWNVQGIAENPNITYEIFKRDYKKYKHILNLYVLNSLKLIDFKDEKVYDYIISYESLSENPYLDFTFVEKNNDKDWNWKVLSKNKNITIDFIKKYIHKLNIRKLLKNPALNYDILKFVLETKLYNPEYDFYKIAKNPSFKLSWLDLFNKYSNIDIDLNEVVKNKNVSWDDIMNSEKLKNQTDIRYNPNVTLEIIESNPQIKWDFYYMSCNSNITWENIKKTLDKYNWSIKVATYNPNVTWSIVKENLDLNWDWCYICLTFKINEEDIDKYPIDFTYFSSNPYITMDLVKKYSHKHWNYNELIKTIF